MRSIRRLYIYLVAFISLEVVLWGLIGLARSIFSNDQIGGPNQLASALSLIFVGVPVFLLHWWLAQKNNDDPGERFARLRALFVYGTLLATIIPVVQNVLALINRFWLSVFGISTHMAFIGEGQTWVDNLIAILMNALIAAYILSVERKDWQAVPKGDAYPETRRLYRYIWVIYSLAMVVGGTQQVIHFIFNLAETLGDSTQAELANGLTLLILGTPLWVYFWQRIVQKSLEHPSEKRSTLRIFILYVFALIGVGGVLIPAGLALGVIFRAMMGEAMSWQGFLTDMSGPLSAAVPFGGIWAYFGRILTNEVAAMPDTPRRAALRRLYNYILAAIGLTASFVGLQMLIAFIIDILIDSFPWGITLRNRLSAALATLFVGLPLWVLTWSPMIIEATADDDAGDHARRSLVRKAYLYLALFAGVIGLMVSAGSLFFQILSNLLGDPPDNFARSSLMLVEMLILFAGLLAYHWMMLRADGRKAAQSLAARHATFQTVVLDQAEASFSEGLIQALLREMPTLPTFTHLVETSNPDESLADAKIVILPGDLAANPSAATHLWLQDFKGIKLVVPTPTEGWYWTFGSGKPTSDLMRETVKMVQHLAEGEGIEKSHQISGWMVVVYILGGLVGIPILFSLFSLLGEILY